MTRRALKLLALVLGLGFVAGEGYLRWQHRGIAERHDVAGTTPYVSLVPGAPRTRGTAILIHGARCSAAMMIPLGRMLARSGVATFIPEMPGHGASPSGVRLVCDSPDAATLGDCAPRMPDQGTLESVLHDLRRVKRIAEGPLVLIGHSWGGRMVDALNAVDAGAGVVGRVSLEGGAGPAHRTNNELYVAGAWYEGRPADSPPPGGLVGRFEDLTAFRYLATGKRHLALVRDGDVNASILDWVERALGEPIGRDARPLYALPVVLSVILLLFVAIVFLLAAPEGAPEPGAPSPALLSRRGAMWCGTVLLSSMVVCRIVSMWLAQSIPFLKAQQALGFLLLPYFQSVGLLAAPVCFGLSRRRASACTRSALREAALALGLLGAVSGVVLGYVSSSFLHAWVAPPRWSRFLVLALLSIPIASVVRWLPAALGVRRSLRFGGTLALWGVLFASWGVAGGFDRLELAELCLSVFLLESFTEVLRRPPPFSAVFVASSLAWAFTSLYPVVDGLDFPPPAPASLRQ